MGNAITSKHRARLVARLLFLIGLIFLIFTDHWWPPIMLVVGIPLALKQFLLGKLYDMAITLLVFVGTFITVQFDIAWEIFLPILFTLGAIYVFFKEFFGPEKETEEEVEEDTQHEIEEDQKK